MRYLSERPFVTFMIGVVVTALFFLLMNRISHRPERMTLYTADWQCTAEERASLIATQKPLWTWTRVRQCAQWTRNDLAEKQKREH